MTVLLYSHLIFRRQMEAYQCRTTWRFSHRHSTSLRSCPLSSQACHPTVEISQAGLIGQFVIRRTKVVDDWDKTYPCRLWPNKPSCLLSDDGYQSIWFFFQKDFGYAWSSRMKWRPPNGHLPKRIVLAPRPMLQGSCGSWWLCCPQDTSRSHLVVHCRIRLQRNYFHKVKPQDLVAVMKYSQLYSDQRR